MRRIARWIGCTTGWWHARCRWTDAGIVCIDCGYEKSRAEHLADLHAGGGW